MDQSNSAPFLVGIFTRFFAFYMVPELASKLNKHFMLSLTSVFIHQQMPSVVFFREIQLYLNNQAGC